MARMQISLLILSVLSIFPIVGSGNSLPIGGCGESVKEGLYKFDNVRWQVAGIGFYLPGAIPYYHDSSEFSCVGRKMLTLSYKSGHLVKKAIKLEFSKSTLAGFGAGNRDDNVLQAEHTCRNSNGKISWPKSADIKPMKGYYANSCLLYDACIISDSLFCGVSSQLRCYSLLPKLPPSHHMCDVEVHLNGGLSMRARSLRSEIDTLLQEMPKVLGNYRPD